MKSLFYSFYFYLFLIGLLTSSVCIAMESSYSHAQQFAGSLQSSVQGAAREADVSIVPYATDRPKESSLGAATLGDAALTETHISEAGQFLKTATATR